MVDGVAILVARDERSWREHLPGTGERLPTEHVRAIIGALERFIAMREEYRRQDRRKEHSVAGYGGAASRAS